MRTERVEDRLVDLEIEDGQDKCQCKRKSLEEPLAQHLRLESPADDRDLLPPENDREVGAAECVLPGVGPHEIVDAALDLDADEHEGEKHGAFEHDGHGLIAETLHRIQRVAQQG